MRLESPLSRPKFLINCGLTTTFCSRRSRSSQPRAVSQTRPHTDARCPNEHSLNTNLFELEERLDSTRRVYEVNGCQVVEVGG